LDGEYIRRIIEESGGLASKTLLARRWGISKQRLGTLSKHHSFPRPIYQEGRMTLYLVCEADKFRGEVRPPGRPAKG